MKFYKWDYDAGIVIQYDRMGACNNCGDCCRAFINMQISDCEESECGDYAEHGGVWGSVCINNHYFFYQDIDILPDVKSCGCLMDDGKCSKYDERLLICMHWPIIPSHVKSFARCSYEFVELHRWYICDL